MHHGLSGQHRAAISRLEAALERTGVEFIPGDDQKGPGVRLRESARKKRRKK